MINSGYLVGPKRQEFVWVKNVFLVVGASIFIALGAFVSIPLPFTPVPIAIQPQMILLVAVALGSKRALAAVALYLAQGVMGLPVFAGGKLGLVTLLGPTGGYLMGYLLAAFITGWIVEKLKARSPLKIFGVMAVGNAVILVCGAFWLSQFLGLQKAFLLGVAPFVIGDLIKLALTSRAAKLFVRV